MAKKDSTAFEPYVGRILHSTLFPMCIVAAPTFCGAMVVYERPAMPEIGSLGLGVNALAWHDSRLPGGAHAGMSRDGNTSLQAAISRIKRSMLEHGAVAEAVVLIGEISPFKPEELKIMAEKLKAKGGAAPKTTGKAPKKGDAEALKAAAKDTPVGGKKAKGAAPAEAPKRKGNIEALNKAREARSGDTEAYKKQKIKVLVKAKDSGLRADSDRQRKLEFVQRFKTVGEALGGEYTTGKTIDRGAISGMVKRGHIELV